MHLHVYMQWNDNIISYVSYITHFTYMSTNAHECMGVNRHAQTQAYVLTHNTQFFTFSQGKIKVYMESV